MSCLPEAPLPVDDPVARLADSSAATAGRKCAGAIGSAFVAFGHENNATCLCGAHPQHHVVQRADLHGPNPANAAR